MNSGSDKFLIYSTGRTGGSALQRSLRLLINSGGILGEFSSDEPVKKEVLDSGKGYEDRRDKLFELLDEEHKTFIGHKCNMMNLNYFDNNFEDITFDLFDYYDKIILSLRNNILKQRLSNIIAAESNVWNIFDSSWDRKEVFDNLDDTVYVDPDLLESELYEIRSFTNKVVNYLESKDKEFCRVSYEGLYGVEDTDFRVRYVKNIVKWLGYDITNENVDEVSRVMSPDNKIMGKDIYSYIENIEEINLKFGSKYGFLY